MDDSPMVCISNKANSGGWGGGGARIYRYHNGCRKCMVINGTTSCLIGSYHKDPIIIYKRPEVPHAEHLYIG